MHTHALRIAGLTLAAAALAACSGSSTGSRALDATRSSVSFEPPTIVAGDGAPSTLRIRVANADGGGIAGAQVSVAMPQAGGSVTQPTARTGTDGVAVASFTTTRAGSWTPVVTVSIDGVVLSFSPASPLVVLPAEPSAAHSDVSAAPATLLADGIAASTVTLRVRDRFGNAVPGASAALAVSGHEAILAAPTVTTDASGTATTTLSATRLGPKRIVASIDEGGTDTELAEQPVVTFTPIAAADESEPNDSPGQARALPLGTAAYGSVESAGDVDFWAVELHAGEVVSVALFASRFSHDTWAANSNPPRLTVWDSSGLQKIVEQDYSGNASVSSWSWDPIDLDLPRFRATTDGPHLISVTQDDQTVAGGLYALVVQPVELGPLVEETTPLGGSAVVHGQHADDQSDTLDLTLAAPSLVSVDLWGYRLGVRHAGAATPDYYDPYLYLRPAGSPDELSNDDHSFYDSGLAAVLPAGAYEIEVGEYSGSQADAPYFADVSVEPLTTIAEVEPNTAPNEAMPITPGQAVAGACLVAADVDHYVFDANAGDLVRVEAFGPLATLPVPVDAQALTVEILDPSLAPKQSSVGEGMPVLATLVTTTGPHYVSVSVPADIPTEYVLRVTVEPALSEVEPNDEAATANPMPPVSRITGVIDVVDDTDTFAFEVAEADQLVAFSLICVMPGDSPMSGRNGLGSSLDARLVVRNQYGAPLAASDGGATPYAQSIVFAESACELAFRAPAAGTYYLDVVDRSGTASPEHYYVLRRSH